MSIGQVLGGFSVDSPREVHIALIRPEELSFWWKDAIPWLERGAQYWSEYYDLADLYVEVFRGTMQLWFVGEDEAPFGCMLTELRKYPRCMVFRFLYAGGDDNQVDKLTPGSAWHEWMIQWAKARGATHSEIKGRRAWEKVLAGEGYEFHGVFLRKSLEKVWSN